ncbi:hypothetical protein RUM44_007280 [Polyplax serrata]|uniref:Uncharacterized protein n=1 Tax=Polyplax serrata TaxID=468196 RepID=A0ABR1B080_POLSC
MNQIQVHKNLRHPGNAFCNKTEQPIPSLVKGLVYKRGWSCTKANIPKNPTQKFGFEVKCSHAFESKRLQMGWKPLCLKEKLASAMSTVLKEAFRCKKQPYGRLIFL